MDALKPQGERKSKSGRKKCEPTDIGDLLLDQEPSDNTREFWQSLDDEGREVIIAQQGQIFKAVVNHCYQHLILKAGGMAGSVFPEQLDQWNEEIEQNELDQRAQQAISHLPLDLVAQNRSRLMGLNYTYSQTIPSSFHSTNQQHSGRCWIFAGLNAMRMHLHKELNLGPAFELSPAYLFFYDKLERCNFFLEKMIELRHLEANSTMIHGLLTYAHAMEDGGTWDFFKNLVLKYGVMPKSNFDECYNTSFSDGMNTVLRMKLNSYVAEIRRSKKSDQKLRELKGGIWMSELYRLIVKFMGTPPQQFNWEYKDDMEISHTIRNQTPLDFYRLYIQPSFQIENKIVLAHDPRPEHPVYQRYSVDHFSNCVGGQLCSHINVPMEVMKSAAIRSLKQKHPMWFTCDVGKYHNSEAGLLDDQAFNYSRALNTDFTMSKQDQVSYRVSTPCHAMLLVGVHLENNGIEERSVRWRIENSWGSHHREHDPGHLMMSDTWFDRYVYQIVVDRDCLEPETLERINMYDVIKLDFNDPYGAVAGLCHCQRTVRN